MKIEILIIFLILGVAFIFFLIRNSKSSKPQLESGSEDNNQDTNSIFYHEDDYRQVEIVPNENFNELIRQAENIQDFTSDNSEGAGYSEIFVREEGDFKLINRAINRDQLEEIFSELPTKKYTEVTTGIQPDEMKSENTIGYGENYNGVFFDYKSDLVTGIWISGETTFPKENFIQVLNKLGHEWNLLLMDWNSLELIDLKNKKQIEKYLK